MMLSLVSFTRVFTGDACLNLLKLGKKCNFDKTAAVLVDRCDKLINSQCNLYWTFSYNLLA
jgi:hypothetical protein